MRSGSVGTANAYRKAGGGFRSHVAGQYVTIVQPDKTSTAAPTASTDPVIHPNQPSVASTPQNVLPRAGLRCWYFRSIGCQTKKKFHCANKYSYRQLCDAGTLDPGRILDDTTRPKVVREGAIRLLIGAPFCAPGAFHV